MLKLSKIEHIYLCPYVTKVKMNINKKLNVKYLIPNSETCTIVTTIEINFVKLRTSYARYSFIFMRKTGHSKVI